MMKLSKIETNKASTASTLREEKKSLVGFQTTDYFKAQDVIPSTKELKALSSEAKQNLLQANKLKNSRSQNTYHKPKTSEKNLLDCNQSIYQTYETSHKYSFGSEETWDVKDLKKSLIELSEMNCSPEAPLRGKSNLAVPEPNLGDKDLDLIDTFRQIKVNALLDLNFGVNHSEKNSRRMT